MEEKIITTPCGQIKAGTCQWDNVDAYKGIRYATAGRWEYPTEVDHWEGVYNATEYKNACYQPRSFYDESKNSAKVFYYNEFRKDMVYPYSEDCLFLNIFTPSQAKEGDKVPVIFYIHGGSYTGGCGNEKHFDGPVWATKGAIGVTINYRLGPYGFICLPELKEEAGRTGNYGLYDQVTALKWVKHNIASFGGDPDNVTIMGQSAGAMSVQTLCTANLGQKLFSKAVMSSGGGILKLLSSQEPSEKRFAFWHKVMENAGCQDLSAFRKLEPEKLYDAYTKAKAELKPGMIENPCIDGMLFKKSQYATAMDGQQADIPYMIGSNSEDIFPPVFYSMARKWCLLEEKQEKKLSYCYHFNRRLPGDDKGAWHSSDLWYWFGTLKNCWRPMNATDEKLSDTMASYLVNFAKTGDPNGDGLPEWKPMTKAQPSVMELGETITLRKKIPLLPMLKVMIASKAVGE